MDIGPTGKFSDGGTWDLQDLKRIVGKWQAAMHDAGGWNALFLENHDQGRSISRFAAHRAEHRALAAKMLATFVSFQAGTLFVYQGQELGMANLPASWGIEEYKDLETLNFYREFQQMNGSDEKALEVFMANLRLKARDHARSPIQWDETANAGFSSGTPWMRVADDYPEWNAAKQIGDSNSVHSYWSRLLKLRKHYKNTFVYGGFDLVDCEHPQVFCYRRSDPSATAYVILNFVEQELCWVVPSEVAVFCKPGALVLSNYARDMSLDNKTMLLRPFEALVLIDESEQPHL